MLCKRKFNGPSLQTSICTCEHQHKSTAEDFHTACVGRIVDRTFRIAKRIGETKLASKIYRQAYGCRPTKQGDAHAVEARNCLFRVLDKHVLGSRIDVPKATARKLLSAYEADSEEETAAAVMKLPASAKQTAGTRISWSTVSWRVFAVCAYLVGLVIILIGLSDIHAYWRRHRSAARRQQQFTQLPDTARALYSKLFT
jgi:hypothetical protein